ncbi:MAG: FAD-dependent oxidoreductase [Promethearchaeota archaeon]|jgi:NADPH-dependent 2,4-dienoyl-CoA reductase/sulfur reductase-like enzyme/Fe-S-cluster-containing hydrogenase component 2/bacterioferritin-associated ferredoxin
MEGINTHPILDIPERKVINFSFDGKILTGYEGMVISSTLFLNNIKVFGHHVKDQSPQGIFCANGQCSQCNVIANGTPVKACMTPLREDMVIESCNGLPELPAEDSPVTYKDPEVIDIEILVIGGGPAGLAATQRFGENELDVILVDDKEQLGGKLVLQTHKFFGSQKDVYAGKRGIEIGKILASSIRSMSTVRIWLNSVCLAVFSDGFVGILKNNEKYVLVKPKYLLVATGAREKMLIFPGNTIPGVYGAGAFQTLVNRDLIKAAKNIFIVGGGNVGLIAGYHAIQAGIGVMGLIEAMPQCGGYKVHEDKLRRLGVPIYTNHTILAANGQDKVESITIGKRDKNGEIVLGSEKTYKCDTILIAVGLNPVDDFYLKAQEYGLNVWVAGDAQEIAEASAAIFTGKIEALKILEDRGIKITEDLDRLQQLAKIMKYMPPSPNDLKIKYKNEGIYPVFYCNQEIPCNPCTSVCPNEQIETVDNLITQLPYFKGEQDCIGCGKCTAVCPGLAVVLLDFRKDPNSPLVTFPLELAADKLEKGQKIIVAGNDKELGEFEVYRTRVLNEYPKTQLITVQLPSEIAKRAVAIKLSKSTYNESIEVYQKANTEDDTIVCRCERVSVGEIRKWIRSGVKDFNELKALTKAGMGSCGAKTCTSLIYQIFREEGILVDEITAGTKRPLFIEVPMGIFAGVKDEKEGG